MLQDIIRFSIGGHEIAIHGFGLMMVIGFLGGMYLVKFLARKSGLDGELFANAALLALFSGVIGARISHVLENFSDFTRSDSLGQNLWDMINISSGGLTYYGGFLLATPTLIAYAMWKKLPLRLGMDIIAPGLMVGLAFGRVGCFLNGCCYGAECDLPWAVHFPYGSYAYEDEFQKREVSPPGELLWPTAHGSRLISPREIKQGYVAEQTDPKRPASIERVPLDAGTAQVAKSQRSRAVHPAQLYSTFTAFLLAAVLAAYFTMPHKPGMVFALMLMLEGLARFVLEMVRVEPPVTHIGGFGLSLSMVLGLLISAAGAVLAFAFSRLEGTTQSAPAGIAIA